MILILVFPNVELYSVVAPDKCDVLVLLLLLLSETKENIVKTMGFRKIYGKKKRGSFDLCVPI